MIILKILKKVNKNIKKGLLFNQLKSNRKMKKIKSDFYFIK